MLYNGYPHTSTTPKRFNTLRGIVFIYVAKINQNLQRDAAPFHAAACKLAHSVCKAYSAFAYGNTNENQNLFN